ncbi:MAG: ribonuclease PH [Candidatus Xenobia bacterium]
MRSDGRKAADIRPVKLQRGYMPQAEGSVLVSFGETRVICTATVEDRVPPFLKDTGRGWVTAEYSMLPRSTLSRISRERAMSGGRTHEIQRLIGRALRATVDMEALGPRTVTLDCDVLVADGGTRTAALTGATVALAEAAALLSRSGAVTRFPLRTLIAAISVGVVGGRTMVDLSYEEDVRAETDMNVAMLASGQFVEVQGTAERDPFDRRTLDELLTLSEGAIRRLISYQRQSLSDLPECLPLLDAETGN